MLFIYLLFRNYLFITIIILFLDNFIMQSRQAQKSLYREGWPQTWRYLPACTSQVLGLKMIPRQLAIFCYFTLIVSVQRLLSPDYGPEQNPQSFDQQTSVGGQRSTVRPLGCPLVTNIDRSRQKERSICRKNCKKRGLQNSFPSAKK